ncbi:MAG: hypothetical protein KDN05_21565, partial [Verrucomicrobiae bacterium]|nr:hypothetical protein [Verrucomicrobiae bacterium]
MKPKSRSSRSFVGSVVTCVAVVSLTSVNRVHASSWTGGAADNDWDNTSNWDSNPSGGLGAVNNLTNIPIITSDNTVVANDVNIADSPGTTGQIDIVSGKLSYNYWSKIGDWDGNATLNIGDTSGSGGTFSGLDLGSGSYSANIANNNNNLMVGLYQSTGVINMNTTGTLDTIGLWIAPNNQSGGGTFNLDAGTVNVSGDMQVGSDFWGAGTSSNGHFNMSGGTVNVDNVLTIGRLSNTVNSGTSDMTVNGGTVNVENNLVVGFNGLGGTTAKLIVDGSSAVVNVGSTTARWLLVGQWDTTNATLEVKSGGKVNLNSGTDLRLAENGNTGTLSVLVDNATVQGSDDGNGDLSYLKGGNSGAIITIQNNGQIKGISGGHDTWNGKTIVKSGGVLEAQWIAGAGSAGGLYLDGGTVRAMGDQTGFINFWGGSSEAYISANGATIDNAGFNISVTGNDNGLLEDPASTGGGLTLIGSGTTTLANTSTYTGDTIVSAGTLIVSGALGSTDVTVSSGATIGGPGSL